jgi:hypothetical protein
MKKLKAAHYMAAVFIAGVIALVYFSQGQTQESEPKIKLSYFKSNTEVAEAVYGVLQQDEMHKQNHYWFGIEPMAPGEIAIYKEIKTMIEKGNGPFEKVYVDHELKLTAEEKNILGATAIWEIKEDWGGVSKDLQAHADKKVLVITAAIYSTNMIKLNPISKIKEASGSSPVTLSMGFFAAKTQEESKNIFRCVTDDAEGVSGWGCVVINKARGQRRKIDVTKIDPPASLITGLMDKTGDKDYMILVR